MIFEAAFKCGGGFENAYERSAHLIRLASARGSAE